MKHVVFKGWICTIVGLLIKLTPIGWLLTFLAVATAKWETEPRFDQWGKVSTIRAKLRKGFRWLGTMDDDLPGGTYEPTVAKMLEKRGKFLTSWYWIGWRNTAHGFRQIFSIPSDEISYTVNTPEGEGTRPDGTWWKIRRMGPFIYQTGFRIYKYLDGSYWATPTATVKKRDRNV